MTPFLGDEDFATALIVDASDCGPVTLLACGHPPPLLIPAHGAPRVAWTLTPSRLPLGLGGEDGESVHASRGEAGDRLLLYTDGLSEARDDKRPPSCRSST